MLHQVLEQQLRIAVTAVLPDADTASLLVRPCPDPKFGDYQSNALMSLAKTRKMNPRQLATDVVAKLDVSQWCEKVEIAGAGFLNFRVKPDAITQTLQSAFRGEHLFYTKANQPRTIVIDFSSPNVAKPMHVGHIRSTGIGDSLQRVLRLLGHHVVTDNHIGDWGTQFGKLVVGWKELLDRATLESDPIGEMERLYKLVNAQCDADPARLELAKQELVKLQAGDPDNLAIWKEMIRLSQVQFDTIYGRLGVKFDHTLGESFYNPWLGNAVADLALVRKSDGGFNYMTTDLATIEHRLKTWSPDEIIYVVDDRQAPHFRKLFLTFARWQPDASKRVTLRHVGFGKILGDDGKPFKTRSGDTVKLGDLLDEAVERALKVVVEKNPDMTDAQQREIARVIGIGGVKYADLLPNRQSDYVFNWDKMLALTGNTAPYLQYAYARIRSIFRKAQDAGDWQSAISSIQLNAPEELGLARHLLNFGLALEAVGDECRPNFLCNYLYELSGHFARFYEACPVLKAEGAERVTRLLLCELTSRVLKQGLEALGIEVLEQM